MKSVKSSSSLVCFIIIIVLMMMLLIESTLSTSPSSPSSPEEELFEQFASNIESTLLPIKKLLDQFIVRSNSRFEKIERIIKKVLPNYLVQSLSPEHEYEEMLLNNFHIETNYQYSKSTDEYATFKILTKQEQNILLFILGTATRTFTDIFGNDFISQPENAYLKNLIEFTDQENYEHDLIKLKVRLFFKEVERNIKEGDSKEKIGWLFKKYYKTFSTDQFEFDTQVFTSTYPLDDCSSIRGVLFIGGLYTDWYPFYFDGLKESFTKCGVDFRISQVDTGKGVESNAEFLQNEIVNYFNELNNITSERDEKENIQSDPSLVENSTNRPDVAQLSLQKILVIGHSKGACDVTYALAKYENELKPYVRGLISLQAPYAGSALANDITEFGAAKILLLKILIEDVLGGELQAIEDMSYNSRMKQVTQYPYPSSTFPCVAMSSYEDSPVSLMYPAISYLKARYNVSNDGLVPTMDGFIPGCKNIIIKDMDHSGSAFTGFPNLSKYDPSQLSLTLIHMWNHYFTKHN